MRCWSCGCPTFTIPVRVNGTATVRFDGDRATVLGAQADDDLPEPVVDDPAGEGPACVMCSARLWDDPALVAASDADLLALEQSIADRVNRPPPRRLPGPG